MNAKLLSPSQAAELLGIGASTLRLWSRDFAIHLSETARGGGGRRRHYTPDDIATLTRARDLLRSGATVADVAGRLGVVSPDAASAALITTALTDELQQTRAAVASLASEVLRLRDQQTATAKQHAAALGNVIADSAQLASEVAELRAQVAELRKRGFWARLFNRP